LFPTFYGISKSEDSDNGNEESRDTAVETLADDQSDIDLEKVTSSEICVDMCQSDDEHVNDILTEESKLTSKSFTLPPFRSAILKPYLKLEFDCIMHIIYGCVNGMSTM
jgi:hypothetical protein